MLDKEFKYYKEHQQELLKSFKGKFLVIKGEKVLGAYDSHAAAYNEAIKSQELGTFLIQHCIPGSEGYSQTFYSRAIIHKVAS